MAHGPEVPSTDGPEPSRAPGRRVHCKVYYTGTQWCFRRLEEFSQGITRISKSHRSFCRQIMGKEGGVNLGPGLPPPNRQPLAQGTTSQMAKTISQIFFFSLFFFFFFISQIFLVNSLTPGESPSLLSAHHPDLVLTHTEGRDRFSLTSVWPAGPVQAGQPEGLGGWGTGWGVCVCRVVTSSSVPAARGQVVRSTRSPVTALFRQAVLPISTVRKYLTPATSWDEGQEQVRGAGTLPLTQTSHLSPQPPISHSLPLGTSTLVLGFRTGTGALWWGSLGREAEAWAGRRLTQVHPPTEAHCLISLPSPPSSPLPPSPINWAGQGLVR